ncbi:membrane protein of unknown function [Magnetospira sp. QH-2]|nr:membrane protein of unknown function [Magnetospira sp. QH-2]
MLKTIYVSINIVISLYNISVIFAVVNFTSYVSIYFIDISLYFIIPCILFLCVNIVVALFKIVGLDFLSVALYLFLAFLNYIGVASVSSLA